MHKTREKKKEERIRLKTNGFGRRRRIVASPYTVFLSRTAVSQESEHLAVALVHNTSEVSELLSHHFLSHLERTKLPPPKRTVPRNHAFAVAIPVKPFSNTGIPNKNTEEFTRSAGPSPGDCEATTEPTASSPALQTPRVCSRRRLSVAPRCRRFIVPSPTMIGRVRRLPRHRPVVVVVVVVVRATLPRGPARGIFESDATTTRGGAPANPRRDDMRWSKDFPPTFWNVVRTFDTGRLKRILQRHFGEREKRFED